MTTVLSSRNRPVRVGKTGIGNQTVLTGRTGILCQLGVDARGDPPALEKAQRRGMVTDAWQRWRSCVILEPELRAKRPPNSRWAFFVNVRDRIAAAFGVASVRKEWLNVAKTLEVGTFRRAFTVILPAAAPTILTGMRISIGIAWLVIVAAEMLVGGTGIGYFVWNEWNNLSIASVISAILLIGVVGMLLDLVLARLTRLVTFPE